MLGVHSSGQYKNGKKFSAFSEKDLAFLAAARIEPVLAAMDPPALAAIDLPVTHLPAAAAIDLPIGLPVGAAADLPVHVAATVVSLKMFPVGQLAHGGSKRRAHRRWTHVSAKRKNVMQLVVARGGFITPVALLFKIQTKDLLASQ